MTRKTKSIVRVTRQFRNNTTADIRSAANATSPAGVRQALGKPNLADATARAYGRLAKQYIDILGSQNQREINTASRVLGVNLKPGDAKGNLKRANPNRFKGGTPPTPPVPPTPPPRGWLAREFHRPTTSTLSQQLGELLALGTTRNHFHSRHGMREFRAILELRTLSGNVLYTSTPISRLPGIAELQQMFKDVVNLGQGWRPGPGGRRFNESDEEIEEDPIVECTQLELVYR